MISVCIIRFCKFLLVLLLTTMILFTLEKRLKYTSLIKPNMGSIEDILAGKVVTIKQDDKLLITYIRKKMLDPPSKRGYSLQWPNVLDQSTGQANYILTHILKNKRNGIFVECGALDGELRSNTLFMERQLGWTGLLVEADPANYQKVLTINRNAWSSNVCLATKPHPHVVRFEQNFNIGKIIGDVDLSSDIDTNISNLRNETNVQCIPFYSLAKAMNYSVIDYFSLDVEGSELQVLKTIPFDKILIKVLSVEFVHTDEGKDTLREFMESWGYRTAKNVHFPLWPVADFIFVHKTVT